jgi:hypothetical protein
LIHAVWNTAATLVEGIPTTSAAVAAVARNSAACCLLLAWLALALAGRGITYNLVRVFASVIKATAITPRELSALLDAPFRHNEHADLPLNYQSQ